MFELTLEPEVEIIDLITLISVVCISISFVYTRTKDRWFRSKKYEDEIRAALGSHFNHFAIGSCRNDFWGIEEHVWTVVCRKA